MPIYEYECRKCKAHVEVFRHAPLDLLDRHRMPRFFLENVLQQMLDDIVGQLLAAKRSERSDPHERAFQPAQDGGVASVAAGHEAPQLYANPT